MADERKNFRRLRVVCDPKQPGGYAYQCWGCGEFVGDGRMDELNGSGDRPYVDFDPCRCTPAAKPEPLAAAAAAAEPELAKAGMAMHVEPEPVLVGGVEHVVLRGPDGRRHAVERGLFGAIFEPAG